ncbi:hypothetical protein, partial [Enterobacter hormaechei]
RNTVRTLMRNRRVLGQRRARVAVLAARVAPLLHRLRLQQAKNNPTHQVLFTQKIQPLKENRAVFTILISHHRFMPL